MWREMEVAIWGIEEVQAVVVGMRRVSSVVMHQVESKSVIIICYTEGDHSSKRSLTLGCKQVKLGCCKEVPHCGQCDLE